MERKLWAALARLVIKKFGIMSILPKDDPIKSVYQVFTPTSPVEMKQLFAGRATQMVKILGILEQPGQHSIIYGDRGVGKTSFSNIVKLMIENSNQVVKVACDSQDTFESLWKKILTRFSVKCTTEKTQIGFNVEDEVKEDRKSLYDLVRLMPMDIDTILKALNVIPDGKVIIDEFDRLEDSQFDKKLFADLVKGISDNLPWFKLIMVGVAEDVATLISGHESIERNLSQVYMPVMASGEIREIITNGAKRLNLSFKEDVIEEIVQLSAGYPHFTHSLCLHSAILAIRIGQSSIDSRFTGYAIRETVESTHESLKSAFMKAKWTTKKTIFKEVLYAASLVKTDEHGFFQANDLTGILNRILGRQVTLATFTNHLKKFCEPERGEILRMAGSPNKRRYKFRNPLMKAFVIINKTKEQNEHKPILDPSSIFE